MSFRSLLGRVALVALLAVGPVLAAPPNGLPFTHMYVLGDSLSDQGNLLFASTQLGGPIIPAPQFYADGRFSNGENYAGLLAQKLGIALSPSELGGTNFAFGGARTDYDRAEYRPGVPAPINGYFPIGAYPWSLEAQIDEFLSRPRSGNSDPNGLYVVFSGSNDLSDALFYVAVVPGFDPLPMVARAVQGILDGVVAFKSAGATTILVPLMPNLGLIPEVRGTPLQPIATALSFQFNASLSAALATIEGPDIVTFDTFATLTALVQNPAAFGFTNVTDPCFTGFVDFPFGTVCANPDGYAFWDREHPTTKVHSILANLLYETALQCAPRGSGRSLCAVNMH